MPRRLADLEADFNPELLCHRCGTGLTALIGTATDVELDALEIAIWVARRRTDVVGNLPQEVLPSVFRFLSIRDVVRQPPTFAHRILSPPSRNRQCARMHLLQCIPPTTTHHRHRYPSIPPHTTATTFICMATSRSALYHLLRASGSCVPGEPGLGDPHRRLRASLEELLQGGNGPVPLSNPVPGGGS